MLACSPIILLVGACCVPVAVAQQQSNIVKSPQSVNISLNGMALLTCIAIADIIDWNINDEPLDDRPGFDKIIVPLNQTQRLYRSTLSAVGSPANNNISITCVAFILKPLSIVSSEPALLRIQGVLKPVNDLTVSLINSTTVLITWSPPFTLEGVPILGYNVTITNTISGENETMLVEDTTLLYTVYRKYIKITVIVIPINEIGAGKSADATLEMPLPSTTMDPLASVPATDVERLSALMSSTIHRLYTTSTTVLLYPTPVNNGTTAQLPIVQLVGIISPVVTIIAFILLTSFIVMICWIRRCSKGKAAPADVQDVIITANNPVYELLQHKTKRIDLYDNSAYGVVP